MDDLDGSFAPLGADDSAAAGGHSLMNSLSSGHRDAVRMLFREFRTRSQFAIRSGATSKANRDKCRRFLSAYKALSGEKERDKAAVGAMLDALQPADNPGAAITLSTFVEGLGQAIATAAASQEQIPGEERQQEPASGEARFEPLGRWIETSARPILEEQIPPKYWQAMLRVKQALSTANDAGSLKALLKRNDAALKKLFDSQAMSVGGIGRLGRGKALTVQQTHSIFLRCSVQGPWLSMHGTDLIVSLVKAWSSADSSKASSGSIADDSMMEEDNAITKREFTRCLMMAAYVMYCGGTIPGKGIGGVGDNVHDALLSLFAEMESSEQCKKLSVRFSGVGGAKVKNVLTRSTDGLAPTASSKGTPARHAGTPRESGGGSGAGGREARTLATVSNIPAASPAHQPRSTPPHSRQKRVEGNGSQPPPTPSTPMVPEHETALHTPAANATPLEEANQKDPEWHSPRFDAVRRSLSNAVSASGQKVSATRPVSANDALLAAQQLRSALSTPVTTPAAGNHVVPSAVNTPGSHTQAITFRLTFAERVSAQDDDDAILSKLRRVLASDRTLFGQKMDTARDLFSQMDRDGNGTVDEGEFRTAFQRLGLGITTEQLEHLIGLVRCSIDFLLNFDCFATVLRLYCD